MSQLIMSRRTLLRGLGTAIALPVLDAMIPTRLLGADAKAAAKAGLSAARKNDVPATNVSAPAARYSGPVVRSTPPSTSRRNVRPRASRQSRSCEIFGSMSRRKLCPPKPG